MTALALLATRGRVYLANQDPSRFAPTSAIVRLIQGVYAREPRDAHFILRHRIHATHAPTPMCSGTVKVAAKKLTAPSTSPFVLSAVGAMSADRSRRTPITEAAEIVDLTDASDAVAALPAGASPAGAVLHLAARTLASEAEAMALARSLAAAIPRPAGPFHARARPVAALLLSPEGVLLHAAVNTNAVDRTRHAEVNLVQGFFRHTSGPLPPGSRVVTTLKPCRMCAGFLWCGSADPASLRVVYGDEDPGRFAHSTVLDLGSPARRLAARSDLELRAPILAGPHPAHRARS